VVTYEENEDHKESEEHRRKSRKASRGLAAAIVAWAVVNLIVYSTQAPL
jgi:hypothetical protein